MNNNSLSSILVNIQSHKEMVCFLNALLTPKELETLDKRIKIIKMLKKGIPHHQIAEKLSVGVATVTRGSKELQQGGFKQIK